MYPLHTGEEIRNFYYETAKVRTGDKYSNFVGSMMDVEYALSVLESEMNANEYNIGLIKKKKSNKIN